MHSGPPFSRRPIHGLSAIFRPPRNGLRQNRMLAAATGWFHVCIDGHYRPCRIVPRSPGLPRIYFIVVLSEIYAIDYKDNIYIYFKIRVLIAQTIFEPYIVFVPEPLGAF